MLFRAIVAAVVVAAVSELAERYPRLGALLLTLPVISIVAFVATWQKDQQIDVVSRLARETLVLVPLGLTFFVPLALAERLGLGFWTAFTAGVVLASATIGLWFWVGPQTYAPTD